MDGVKLATSDPFVVMNSHHAYETYIRVFIDQLQMEKNNLAQDSIASVAKMVT